MNKNKKQKIQQIFLFWIIITQRLREFFFIENWKISCCKRIVRKKRCSSIILVTLLDHHHHNICRRSEQQQRLSVCYDITCFSYNHHHHNNRFKFSRRCFQGMDYSVQTEKFKIEKNLLISIKLKTYDNYHFLDPVMLSIIFERVSHVVDDVNTF